MAQKTPTREITAIAGDLYRVRNNFHFSVFLVTPAGIIVTDPIDVEAARWLKEELARRFDKPIKYLIYSHDHTDHV
ncbi:MAG: MBL fold metallo-hydrolase, partial [Candidatus Binatia bacterium]